ncbi:unnamed protein product [Arctogadus glacialis]
MRVVWNIALICHACFICTSSAQPGSSKLHEGWWAYKDVIQGSFVPGKGCLSPPTICGKIGFSVTECTQVLKKTIMGSTR